jgi:hypothetical protein
LAGLARRDGFDVKPTLLRVLTDFYVQRAYHPPQEEQHFIELALRLIDEVDPQTLLVVERRLTEYEGAPRVVLQRLAARLNAQRSDIALNNSSVLPTEKKPAGAAKVSTEPPGNSAIANMESGYSDDIWDFLDTMAPKDRPANAKTVSAEVAPADRRAAAQYSEQFFAADSAGRRSILQQLDTRASVPPLGISRTMAVQMIQRLEIAALKGRPYDFVREIERTLSVPRAVTERIINDTSGELLLVIAKALAMPIDVVQRILLLLNPAIGMSVKRVFELSSLYQDMSEVAALRLISLWRNAAPLSSPEMPAASDSSPSARRATRESERAPTLREIFPVKRDQRAS